MGYDKNLIPIFENGRIINLRVILDAIAKNDNAEELHDLGREALFPVIRDKVAREDLEVIQRAIDFRLEELEEKQLAVGVSNKNALEEIKKENINLDSLSIIETKKETNDSKRNTDYIKFVDKDGNVQLLECALGNSLNNFILKNQELVYSGGAKEIFEHLRKYVHKTLEFEDFSDNMVNDTMEQIKQNGVSDSLISNEKLVAEEKSLIEDFVKKQKLVTIPRVSVNSHGERIYNIGEIVIKFRDDYGIRKMEIISGQHLVKEANELQEVKVESSKNMTTNEKHSMMHGDGKSLIDETKFIDLLNRLNNKEKLTFEEKAGMKTFISNLISKTPNIDSNIDFVGLIDAYESYLDTYEIPLLTEAEFNNLNTIEKMILINSKLSAERMVDEMEYTAVIEPANMQNATNILGQLYMGESVSVEQIKVLNQFINNALTAIENGRITEDEKNLLGMYLEYLKEIKTSPLAEEEEAIIERHHNYELTIEKPKTLKLTLPPNDTSGIITTITIIEVVTLLGFLIAVIALVRG